MKRAIQSLLRSVGLLERFQTSILYDAYWSVLDRRVIERRRAETRFYGSVLTGFQRGSLVVDVGANHGDKTDVFLRLGARVVAVEPDEYNQEVLKRRFWRYRISRKPVVIVPEALSDRRAVETMWIDAAGSALNTLSQKWVETLRGNDGRFGHTVDFGQARQVATITLDDLFAEHGIPFFVKIDVEGHELSVLRGMKRPVPYLSFEVNLPEFRGEGLRCIEVLRTLDEDGQFNFAADYQRGLELQHWVNSGDVANSLERCAETSVEVFWRTLPARSAGVVVPGVQPRGISPKGG